VAINVLAGKTVDPDHRDTPAIPVDRNGIQSLGFQQKQPDSQLTGKA